MTAKPRRDLSTGQVALRLRMSQQTVIRLCNEGQLPHYKIPGPAGIRRIKAEDAAAFALAHGLPWDEDTEEGQP